MHTFERLAHHLLRDGADSATPLARALDEAAEQIRPCELCFNLTVEVRCPVCQDEGRDQGRLLVVEGYMDVVSLAQFGIRYGVATLGTACGEDHLNRAFRHTTEVVFCFDGDSAGEPAGWLSWPP